MSAPQSRACARPNPLTSPSCQCVQHAVHRMNASVPKFQDCLTKLHLTAFRLHSLCDLQSITTRIANIESIPTLYGLIVGDDFDTSTAKLLFRLSQIIHRVANMSFADAVLSQTVLN